MSQPPTQPASSIWETPEGHIVWRGLGESDRIILFKNAIQSERDEDAGAMLTLVGPEQLRLWELRSQDILKTAWERGTINVFQKMLPILNASWVEVVRPSVLGRYVGGEWIKKDMAQKALLWVDIIAKENTKNTEQAVKKQLVTQLLMQSLAEERSIKSVELIKAGVDVDHPLNEKGETLLSNALKMRRVNEVKQWLALGANPHHVLSSGISIWEHYVRIHTQQKSLTPQMVKVFGDAGCNIHLLCHNGLSLFERLIANSCIHSIEEVDSLLTLNPRVDVLFDEKDQLKSHLKERIDGLKDGVEIENRLRGFHAEQVLQHIAPGHASRHSVRI